MATEGEAPVDTTPISPARAQPERRNSLEKHLQHRPDPQDLKNRNILLDTNAAPYVPIPFPHLPTSHFRLTPLTTRNPRNRALQAAQHELERQRITDNLKKGLEHRPEREDLVQRNILPESNAAPALQAHQKELERHMRADSLEKGLQRRPTADELKEKGILESE
jgi:hypothetical protein